ncbi:hypothetical protein GCM10011571_25030 [Marinithermofilum abyssi]|uniref:Uncharacterized protein n=1 Tax=Marinithermofilum abyssi TaxID=1571185 RepID=A0A8J2YD43_9BACL|nr:hypothetical protein GCM10011571_25030 [Marinithermofilum abyssi]
MTGTASEIKYIQRNEWTHLALFQGIYHELKKENPHLFTVDFRKSSVDADGCVE